MKEESKLTIEEMKRISSEIIEEEMRKNNVKINIFPVTFVEYNKNYVFNKKHNLVKTARDATKPLTSIGFNDHKGNVVIFLNNINKSKKIESKIFRLAEVCYHEARHSMQEKFDEYSYDGFLNDIERFLRNNIDYDLYHDKYSFEIGAHLYGITKAKEYLQTKYPNLYEKEKDEIERKEKRYYYDYIMYDAVDTIDRLIEKIKKDMKKYNFTRIGNLENISPIIEIFLNDTLNFKNLTEIIKNDKFKTLDKRIIYAFLSTKSFLENINLEELKNEELTLITEALQYTSTVYQNQQKKIEEYEKEQIITLKEYLLSQKNIINKLVYVNKFLTHKKIEEMTQDYIYLTRNEERRQTHRRDIPSYLEEATNLVKKRNKGYTIIGILYIIELFISILTIVYISIKNY